MDKQNNNTNNKGINIGNINVPAKTVLTLIVGIFGLIATVILGNRD